MAKGDLPKRKFATFSARTQRSYLQRGVDPQRFDRWLKLTPQTRKLVDRLTYAQGFSAPELAKEARREKIAERVIKTLAGTPTKRPIDKAKVHRNVAQMSAKELRAAAKATGSELRKRAGRKTSKKNKFWY